MPIQFTPAQQKVLDARNHDILVSAAAGSGKTAVLVERIVRLVSEGDHPFDIDRLLVVTFTRAAAAQMRERIGRALSDRLSLDPGNTHLQRQEILLHNAQIMTMDSFFTFLLRNYFSEIDLDPGFRQIDPTESKMIAADVMQEFLEEKYAGKDPAFLRCADYFCAGQDDKPLEELIRRLCNQADSHPSPWAWLSERAGDYDVPDEEALFSMPWMRFLIESTMELLQESELRYDAMLSLCRQPGGPEPVQGFLMQEREELFGGLRECREKAPQEQWEEICRVLGHAFNRYPTIRGKKKEELDAGLMKAVKSMRDIEKERIQKLQKSIGGQSIETILSMMQAAKEPMQTLASLALEFSSRFQAVKKERRLIDFVDLEHYALEILAARQQDGTYVPRRTAEALRSHYAEILIDEYQDSNEVQELMLRIISGEENGHYNRFMVGDIKQSIYRFRLARPEIFMEKYDTYRPDDPWTERIELDRNFRSRSQVLDCVNALFMSIMRREVGGVLYREEVSLKKGAVFPDERERTGKPGHFEEETETDPYGAEFLLLETAAENPEDTASSENTEDHGKNEDPEAPEDPESSEDPEEAGILADETASFTDRQKEALMIAGRIRELVGNLPVQDEQSGQMRPARYGDIVILLRSTVGWNEDLRAVFAREGIPCYAQSRTGYFAAQEIRAVLALLRVLDNPRQDIPLYGVLRGYFGNFTQDEISRIRLVRREGALYDALLAAGSPGTLIPPELTRKCAELIHFIKDWRRRTRISPVSEVVAGLLEETGYADYCAAMPAGTQRMANLRFLRDQADAFTKTDFTGLFHFLRYIDGLNREEIDYGEANTLDENADVVRIMSIHKSKGLEFPVCFVASLSKAFSFRRYDASGQMIIDSDWGAGINYFDPDTRIQAPTLRRAQIAEKIRRDCMGEELRVLYVAMTRAKEKLILTASAKNFEKKLCSYKSQMAGFFHRRRLSPYMIAEASCPAELILKAVLAACVRDQDTDLHELLRGTAERGDFPLRIRMQNAADLTLQAVNEQLDLSILEKELQKMEGIPLALQPDPEAAGALADKVFFAYPHGELQDLYAQTSVSELKHRAMARALASALEGQEEGGTESAAELFAEETPVPYLPSFLREEEPADGARRGTAFHRVLELMDYSILDQLVSDDDPDTVSGWIGKLVSEGRISAEDAALVSICHVDRFLRSKLARRMAAAWKAGNLFREQPFVMGCEADRLDEGLPRDEMVTVQGIIDAFFIENGKICLVDYKTDRVRTKEELTARYSMQLSLYAEALERAFGLPVTEKIIYSTALGREIQCIVE